MHTKPDYSATAAQPAHGLGVLRSIMATGQPVGMAVTLDFRLVQAETGFAAFEGTPGRPAYNPIGIVHGGYAATLLDSACGCAVHACLDEHQTYATLELKVAFHRPLTDKTGLVRAEGRVVSLGKRVAFAEATLTDAAGKLYASATSTLLVIEQ